jgi:hypothetical protein
MKSLLILGSLLLITAPFISEQQKPDLGFPQLHTIKTATLSPSYSCRSHEEFQTGYANTALYLADYSRHWGPDLLFNGACGAKDYFHGSAAGDDMSLVADLGVVPLEELTATKAFRVPSANSQYSRFGEIADVENGHSYAVLINKGSHRGLFVFTVIDHVPNKKVELRYAVEENQAMVTRGESQGFDWEGKNRVPGEEK